jgi:hypothetical protein
MANETLQTNTNVLAQIAVQEGRFVMQNSVSLADYIRQATVTPGQVSARFPHWAGLTASALTEGNAAANQVFSATGVTLTPTTNAVASTVITKLADFSAAQGVALDFGRNAAQAIIRKRNQDIWGLFDGFSTAFGSANTVISEANILAAIGKIRNTGYSGELYLAVTPNVLTEIFKIYAAKTGFYPALLQEQIYAGQAPILFGARVIQVNGISDTAAADVKCGVFAPEALGIATAWDINVDIADKPSSVGYEITASSAYAVGELRDDLGCELLVSNGPSYTP